MENKIEKNTDKKLEAGRRILYIEDNRDTAEAVSIILEDAGFRAELAFSGKEALKKATKGSFDLILLDIMLPDMSGWDIFTKLRERNGFKYVFLSVIPVSSERMDELKKAGVSDYITKPFRKVDLVERVKKVLS